MPRALTPPPPPSTLSTPSSSPVLNYYCTHNYTDRHTHTHTHTHIRTHTHTYTHASTHTCLTHTYTYTHTNIHTHTHTHIHTHTPTHTHTHTRTHIHTHKQNYTQRPSCAPPGAMQCQVEILIPLHHTVSLHLCILKHAQRHILTRRPPLEQLIEAAGTGDSAEVHRLLRAGVCVDAKDSVRHFGSIIPAAPLLVHLPSMLSTPSFASLYIVRCLHRARTTPICSMEIRL
jgi:hypothetical protein